MPTPSNPRKGSMGFSPRKRADREVPSFRSWPDADEPSLQGFAGYKAGMTHVLAINDRSGSAREGMQESVPVTIVETPPLRVAAVRAYRETPYGKRPITEVWGTDLHEDLGRATTPPADGAGDPDELTDADDIAEVRAIAHTVPAAVDGVPTKTPAVMEIPVGSDEEAVDHGLELLDDEVAAGDVHDEGAFVDVSAVTKGEGTQGPVKRWGVRLRKGKHKRQGWRRRIGNLGPWHPSRVRSTVPQQGQTGYHQRTEANKRVIAVGDDGDDATPDGGFVNYGEVSGSYMLVKGSVPGPKKRLVRTRRAIEPKRDDPGAPEIRYVSTDSQQG